MLLLFAVSDRFSTFDCVDVAAMFVTDVFLSGLLLIDDFEIVVYFLVDVLLVDVDILLLVLH